MLWTEYLSTADWSRASWISLGAYLLGCFCTGFYLVRSRTGRDVRELGSGSVGATNVSRILGKSGFATTLGGDFAKGYFAVWAASCFSNDTRLLAMAMISVVAGHVWPIQLRFHGGKGIATALGALAAYDLRLLVLITLLFLFPFAVLRKRVVPGVFAFSVLPFAALPLMSGGGRMELSVKFAALFLLSGIIVLSHRKNMADEFSSLLRRFRAGLDESNL